MKYNPQPRDELKQTLHIVAHLDFLGATEKMKSPEQSSEFLQKLHMIYNDVIDVMTEKELSGDEGVNIRIFSDNIVIAYNLLEKRNEAIVFLRKAAENSSQEAKFYLAMILSESDKKDDLIECLSLLKELVQSGLVAAQVRLGQFYMDQKFAIVETDSWEGFQILKNAKVLCDRSSYNECGNFQMPALIIPFLMDANAEQREFVTQLPKQVEFWKKLNNEVKADCYWYLGFFYREGENNYFRGTELQNQAAEIFDQTPTGQFQLGIYYYEGIGINEDKFRGVEYLKNLPMRVLVLQKFI